jgi:hypothetical protein
MAYAIQIMEVPDETFHLQLFSPGVQPSFGGTDIPTLPGPSCLSVVLLSSSIPIALVLGVV